MLLSTYISDKFGILVLGPRDLVEEGKMALFFLWQIVLIKGGFKVITHPYPLLPCGISTLPSKRAVCTSLPESELGLHDLLVISRMQLKTSALDGFLS